VKTTSLRRAVPAFLVFALAACSSAAPVVRPDEEGTPPTSTPDRATRRATDRAGEKAGERATDKKPGKAGEKSDAAPAADAVPARAQRLFAEAVKSLEDQRDLKVPIDWALMERKWRAVLGAAEVAEAHFNLGVALENQGQAANAKVEYDKALVLKPSLRQAKVNRAVLLERAGDLRGASVAYSEVIQAFPEDSMARERLAALYRASGQADDAWRLSREALLRDPRATGAYKTMIRIAMQRKEFDLAKLIALRAQKLDERDADVAYLLGLVLDRQGEEGGAAAQYTRTLELAPGHLPARYALLDQAVRKEAWPKVAEQAAAVLAQEPKNAAAVLLRGIALRHTEKPDEALAAYEKAEKLSGGALADVYLARGVLFMRDKTECGQALAEFERYTKAVGPILPKGSPVPGLQRECDEMIAANKAAAEAARQMQAEAEKAAAAAAAAEAARKAAEGAVKPPPVPAPPDAAPKAAPVAPAAPTGRK
jgi:tetratricopeptide (TPR) repeat protein